MRVSTRLLSTEPSNPRILAGSQKGFGRRSGVSLTRTAPAVGESVGVTVRHVARCGGVFPDDDSLD